MPCKGCTHRAVSASSEVGTLIAQRCNMLHKKLFPAAEEARIGMAFWSRIAESQGIYVLPAASAA
jgi:hypothetical protein